jgi:hypothetical protein
MSASAMAVPRWAILFDAERSRRAPLIATAQIRALGN